MPFWGKACMFDHEGRGIRWHTRRNQLAGHVTRRKFAHINGKRRPRIIQRAPVKIQRFAFARMSRDELQSPCHAAQGRSEEQTSELQSLMRISYAGFLLKKKMDNTKQITIHDTQHIN